MTPRAGLFGLVAGLLVWSSAFVALYAVHAVGCSLGWQAPEQYWSLLRLVLIGIWLVHLAGLAWLVVWYRRATPDGLHDRAFLRLVALTLGLVALGATLWTGAPVVALELCV